MGLSSYDKIQVGIYVPIHAEFLSETTQGQCLSLLVYGHHHHYAAFALITIYFRGYFHFIPYHKRQHTLDLTEGLLITSHLSEVNPPWYFWYWWNSQHYTTSKLLLQRITSIHITSNHLYHLSPISRPWKSTINKKKLTGYSISDDQHDDSNITEQEGQQSTHVCTDARRETPPTSRHHAHDIATRISRLLRHAVCCNKEKNLIFTF